MSCSTLSLAQSPTIEKITHIGPDGAWRLRLRPVNSSIDPLHDSHLALQLPRRRGTCAIPRVGSGDRHRSSGGPTKWCGTFFCSHSLPPSAPRSDDFGHCGCVLHTIHVTVTLHIDTLSAMTGVTLFQSLYLLRARSSSPLRSFFSSAFPLPLSASNSPNWTYDKSESLPSSGTPGRAAYGRYTHLLTGAPSCAVLFETSASASDGAQDSSNDETRAPLPANEQPFEPFTPPIRAYSGLRRRPVTEYSDSLRGALDMTGRRSFWQRLGGVLPFEIVFRDTIWLCVRKEDAGDESQVARSG